MATIGIDLGTTNSCVAVFRNNKVEVIANDHGLRVTPSYVAFTDEGKHVGQVAKELESENLKNTVYQIKRLIGRKFNDDVVQKDIKSWRFRVVGENNDPKVKVEYKTKEHLFCPEEISAMVLSHMKDIAEDYIGTKVAGAVITVPSYFNSAQRRATQVAGDIAGLNILAMINEPTAAAIAYGLERINKEKRTVLVYDLGGGTFDVTIFDIEKGIFEARATGGDTHLGGEDFTDAMLDYFITQSNHLNRIGMKMHRMAMCRLREKCEQAKRTLSAANSIDAKIHVPSLFYGKDFSSTITRANFEDMNHDDFEKTIDQTKKVMEDARVSACDIDDIVVVGGSSRIPKIRQLLAELFKKEKLRHDINPEEAVAYGAAVQAAIISKVNSPQINSIKIYEVTPLSLGIEMKHDVMSVVVPRNTKIPTKKSGKYFTTEDNQTLCVFPVYEGERACSKENHLLGQFRIRDLLPLPKGKVMFDVRFVIDESGIIDVTAYDKSTGNKNGIKIQNDGRLTEEDVKRMKQDAEKYKKEDKYFRERAKLIHEFDEFIYNCKKKIEKKDVEGWKVRKEKKEVLDKLTKMNEWLNINGKKSTKETLETKQRKLEGICHPFLAKLYSL